MNATILHQLIDLIKNKNLHTFLEQHGTIGLSQVRYSFHFVDVLESNDFFFMNKIDKIRKIIY